ncbi:MAG: NAD(P)-dependent oxidoreductase [Gammaproteobacteria bacterium]|nr:NAD(P)-dependent oxidoreductase [Gammaproteobacteria bacterium]
MPRFTRLLITGAAGNLGTELRKGLAPLATTLRLTDRAEMAPAAGHEEVVQCELGDFDEVMRVVEGCDGVVHFGAAPVEKPWAEILDSSIKGGYNVYEAARRHGIRRVVYASSIHAVGYVRREEGADTDTAHRPDSLYGVSKCFVEDLAKMYFHKFGIESACLRINSCFPEPADRRHLATWMSFRDLVQLVERCLLAERIGHTVVYGISDNREAFFSNHKVVHLGYRPQESAEDYRAAVEAKTAPGDPFDPAVEYVGGVFCNYGHPDDD